MFCSARISLDGCIYLGYNVVVLTYQVGIEIDKYAFFLHFIVSATMPKSINECIILDKHQ